MTTLPIRIMNTIKQKSGFRGCFVAGLFPAFSVRHTSVGSTAACGFRTDLF